MDEAPGVSPEEFQAWAERFIGVIAGEIRRYRREQGLSVQQLSDQIAAQYGLRIGRSVLANLENGHRHTLSVIELVILARVLQVPPLLLLFPVGRRETMEFLPGREVPVWQAATWFTAERPLMTKNSGDLPAATINEDLASWWNGALPAKAFRQHDRLLGQHHSAMERSGRALYAVHKADEAKAQAKEHLAQARRDLAQAETSGDPDRIAACREEVVIAERQAWQAAAAHVSEQQRRDAEQELARAAEERLADHRRAMRREGLIPPPLPPSLRHLDQDETAGVNIHER